MQDKKRLELLPQPKFKVVYEDETHFIAHAQELHIIPKCKPVHYIGINCWCNPTHESTKNGVGIWEHKEATIH